MREVSSTSVRSARGKREKGGADDRLSPRTIVDDDEDFIGGSRDLLGHANRCLRPDGTKKRGEEGDAD